MAEPIVEALPVPGKDKEVFTMTDPVCKMEINREDAEASSEYNGQTYYFCSEECKESFDKRPDKYVERPKKTASGGR